MFNFTSSNFALVFGVDLRSGAEGDELSLKFKILETERQHKPKVRKKIPSEWTMKK